MSSSRPAAAVEDATSSDAEFARLRAKLSDALEVPEADLFGSSTDQGLKFKRCVAAWVLVHGIHEFSRNDAAAIMLRPVSWLSRALDSVARRRANPAFNTYLDIVVGRFGT